MGVLIPSLLAALAVLALSGPAGAASIVPLRDARLLELLADVDEPAPLYRSPSSAFAEFEASLGLYGYLYQDSSVGSQTMSGYGQAVADGGGGTVGSSVFEVDFGVDTSASFSLVGSSSATTGFSFQAAPSNGGIVLLADGNEVFAQDAVGAFDVTGTLQPGVVYTLRAFAHAAGDPFDHSEFSVAFALPEPSGLGALAALALATAGVQSRRRPRGRTSAE
jgi:hypothetical protein